MTIYFLFLFTNDPYKTPKRKESFKMATRPNSEFNLLLKLKKRTAGISEDIRFLSLCIRNRVTPRSHEIRIRSSIHQASTHKHNMERELIKKSIGQLYKKLNYTTLLTYNAHLKLAKSEDQQENLYEMLGKIQTGFLCEKLKKRGILQTKLRKLISRTNQGFVNRYTQEDPVTEDIPGLVVNKSTQVFTEEQLRLLNKGLNHAVVMQSKPIEHIVADVEAAIKFIPEENRSHIRGVTTKTITSAENKNNRKAKDTIRIIKELNEKPVYYMKADKGNKLVIMDRKAYDDSVREKLNKGNYKEIRGNPLPDALKRIEKTMRECEDILGESRNEVIVPNPCLPRLKCLPKIHKEGNEMREIVAAVSSPTQKIAKWLLNEFKRFGQDITARSVKNYKEVIDKILAMGEIETDEVMVSFDIKALFPNVPVKEAIEYLEEWLMKQKNDTGWKYKVKKYIKLARLCMNENHFTFRGKYYKSTNGVNMGNPLSGFISEIFLAKLEEKLEEKRMMPKLWIRYVDDIFAVIDREEVEETLRELNGMHKNMKFTLEVEEEGKIPFLDLLIKRSGKSFSFEIYRKPTHTQRFIPMESNHHMKHKMAAFNAMIHRLLRVPLSTEDFEKEKEFIIGTATKNGYPREVITGRIKNMEKRRRRDELTTLHQQARDTECKDRRTAITYDKNLTGKISHAFKEVGIEVVPTSRMFQLKNLLRSTKDKKDVTEKSGIYRIQCSHCAKRYIGQTRRLVTTRFNEHVNEARVIKKKRKAVDRYRSTVAKHIVEEGHDIEISDVDIIKEVNDNRKLDFYESLTIHKENRELLLNEEMGCCDTPLIRLIA